MPKINDICAAAMSDNYVFPDDDVAACSKLADAVNLRSNVPEKTSTHPLFTHNASRAAGKTREYQLRKDIENAISQAISEDVVIQDPAHNVRRAGVNGLRPKPDLNFVSDVSTGFRQTKSYEAAGSSTQASAMLEQCSAETGKTVIEKLEKDMIKSRLKTNEHGWLAKKRELINGAGDYYINYPYAPHISAAVRADTYIATDLAKPGATIGILSRMMDGFVDFGRFFLSPTKMQANIDAQLHERHWSLLRRHHQAVSAMQKIELILAASSPELAGCIGSKAKHAMHRVNSISEKTKQEIQPLRDLGRIASMLRAEMAALLPREAQSVLIKGMYKSEGNADADFQNHWHYNGGVILNYDKVVDSTQPDKGLEGFSGPYGKTKAESRAAYQVPARLDDPFVFYGYSDAYPKESCTALYRAFDYTPRFNQMLYGKNSVLDLEIATDPRKISHSSALIGAIPRVAIYAETFMGTIAKRQIDDDRRPPEMLEVAYRYTQFSKQDLKNFYIMLRNQWLNSDNQALRELEEADEDDWPEQYADMYCERRTKLILRAGNPLWSNIVRQELKKDEPVDWDDLLKRTPLPFLDTWAKSNPEKKMHIEMDTLTIKNEVALKLGLPVASRSAIDLPGTVNALPTRPLLPRSNATTTRLPNRPTESFR